MANDQAAEFEKEFYSFLSEILKNPATMKQKSAELKRILNKLLVIKDQAELDKIVSRLREAGLFSQRLFHHASFIIAEVESRIQELIKTNQSKLITRIEDITTQIIRNRPSTSEKQHQKMLDFVKG